MQNAALLDTPAATGSTMKFVIERSSLLRALGHVQSVVERRNTIPILSNVMIRAEEGQLSLTATDMDLEVVESVAANVTTAGATTCPAHTFYDIVRKLPDGADIEINGDGQQLTIRSGRSNFRLGCLPTDDFPQMTGGDMPHSFTVAAEELRALIDRTSFAISTEETRYYLNGIYFHAREGEEPRVLRAVATDGHRLARMEVPLPAGAAEMPGVIVPRKTIGEIRKLIGEAAGDVSIALSDTKLRFSLDSVTLTSKLIDGTFPDYERVIPQGNDKVMEVDSKTLARAVDRVSTISSEKSRAVKLSLAANALTLSATSPEAGSATEELEASWSADALEIGFNSKYLKDIADLIDGDAARFTLADGNSPTVIQDSADSGALYVLMPMRV